MDAEGVRGGVDIHLARGNISRTGKREVYPVARGTPRRTRMQGCTSGLGVEGQWDSYGKGPTQGRNRWSVWGLGDRGQVERVNIHNVWFLFVYRTIIIFNLQINLLASPLTLSNPCPPFTYGAAPVVGQSLKGHVTVLVQTDPHHLGAFTYVSEDLRTYCSVDRFVFTVFVQAKQFNTHNSRYGILQST